MNPQKNDDVPMKMLYAHANKFWLWPTLSVLPGFFFRWSTQGDAKTGMDQSWVPSGKLT